MAATVLISITEIYIRVDHSRVPQTSPTSYFRHAPTNLITIIVHELIW